MNAATMRSFRDEYEKIAVDLGPLKNVNPIVIGAGIGALAAMGAQVAANKGANGKKSVQQRLAGKLQSHVDYEEKLRKKEKRKPTFMGETLRISAKPFRELSDLAAKHPLKAALPAAALGARAGISVVKHML